MPGLDYVVLEALRLEELKHKPLTEPWTWDDVVEVLGEVHGLAQASIGDLDRRGWLTKTKLEEDQEPHRQDRHRRAENIFAAHWFYARAEERSAYVLTAALRNLAHGPVCGVAKRSEFWREFKAPGDDSSKTFRNGEESAVTYLYQRYFGPPLVTKPCPCRTEFQRNLLKYLALRKESHYPFERWLKDEVAWDIKDWEDHVFKQPRREPTARAEDAALADWRAPRAGGLEQERAAEFRRVLDRLVRMRKNDLLGALEYHLPRPLWFSVLQGQRVADPVLSDPKMLNAFFLYERVKLLEGARAHYEAVRSHSREEHAEGNAEILPAWTTTETRHRVFRWALYRMLAARLMNWQHGRYDRPASLEDVGTHANLCLEAEARQRSFEGGHPGLREHPDLYARLLILTTVIGNDPYTPKPPDLNQVRSVFEDYSPPDRFNVYKMMGLGPSREEVKGRGGEKKEKINVSSVSLGKLESHARAALLKIALDFWRDRKVAP